MRAKIAYAAILVVFLLIAAMVQWPASSVQAWSERAGAGRWKIGGGEGTIWNGSATLLVADGGGAEATAGGGWHAVQNVRWKLRTSELLRGRIAVDTMLEQGSVLLSVGAGSMSLENLDAQLPAALLAGLVPGPVGRYGWSGILQARAARFSCAKQGTDCSGNAEILWKDAAVSEIPGPQLGNYVIHVVGEGPAIHFDLATLSGRLQISGRGEFGSTGLRFSGEAAASGPEAAQLDAQLRTLGRPTGGSGRYAIEYRDMPSR